MAVEVWENPAWSRADAEQEHDYLNPDGGSGSGSAPKEKKGATLTVWQYVPLGLKVKPKKIYGKVPTGFVFQDGRLMPESKFLMEDFPVTVDVRLPGGKVERFAANAMPEVYENVIALNLPEVITMQVVVETFDTFYKVTGRAEFSPWIAKLREWLSKEQGYREEYYACSN